MKCSPLVRRRWPYFALALGLAIVIAGFAERKRLLASAGGWLNVSELLEEPVDYVMILGGEASTRPFVAAAMVRAGLAKAILVPQFPESDEVNAGLVPGERDIILQVLRQRDVPSDGVVLLDSTVDSTESEARCLAEFLNDHPAARVAVVTSDFHTRRTRLLISRACGNRAGNVRVIGAPTDGFSASNWWQFESGFILYLNEYLKLTRTWVS
jgi:uncharacterized SAM-binding protein YcdF (DUF218 family)